MSKILNITGKLFVRAFALIALSILTILNAVFKVAALIFRYLAVPVAGIGLLVLVVTYFDNGYDPSMLTSFATLVIIGALSYVFPLVPELVGRVVIKLKDYIFSPLTIKSPVRYTM